MISDSQGEWGAMVLTIDTTQIAAVTGALAGSLITIATVYGKFVRPWVKRAKAFADQAETFWADWNGTPARIGVMGQVIVPPRAGMLERVGAVEAVQSGMVVQLTTYNGGSTIRDALRATQTDVSTIKAQLVELGAIGAQRAAQPAVGASGDRQAA